MNIFSAIKTLLLISAYKADIEALICEREGMVAENENRKQNGYSMAYDSIAFSNLQSQFNEISAKLKEAT